MGNGQPTSKEGRRRAVDGQITEALSQTTVISPPTLEQWREIDSPDRLAAILDQLIERSGLTQEDILSDYRVAKSPLVRERHYPITDHGGCVVNLDGSKTVEGYDPDTGEHFSWSRSRRSNNLEGRRVAAVSEDDGVEKQEKLAIIYLPWGQSDNEGEPCEPAPYAIRSERAESSPRGQLNKVVEEMYEWDFVAETAVLIKKDYELERKTQTDSGYLVSRYTVCRTADGRLRDKTLTWELYTSPDASVPSDRVSIEQKDGLILLGAATRRADDSRFDSLDLSRAFYIQAAA